MTPPLHDRKNRIRSVLTVAFSAGCLTALLLAAVYALRGIWPFGADNVAYMDSAQFYVPGFYSLWDQLHGDLWAGDIWKNLLYPYNWPFLFVARDHVLEAMSLYIGIHMILIAVIAGIALDVRFPRLRCRWKTAFALMYAFSGFVLQYYSNQTWLSIVAIFPLLLLGLERLLRDGKYVLYTVMYAFFLNSGVYFTYMATIYILAFALGYTLIVLPKERRGDRIFRLGLSTAAAIGISSHIWINNAVDLADGARFQDNLDTGIETGMTTWDLTNTRHTFLMLMGMALIAALFFRALRRQRTAPEPSRPARSRALRFFLYMLGVFALPMVFTNIDTAWHFGQYNFFPMRYGYMLPATLIAGGCAAMEDEDRYPDLPAPALAVRRPWLFPAAAVLAWAGLALLAPPLSRTLREYGACFLTSLGRAGYLRYFAAYAACGALFALLYLALFRLDRRRTGWLVGAALLLQLGLNAYSLVAPNDDHTYTHEYDPAYIETAEQLHDYLAGEERAPLTRVKNVDNCLNAGYPAIAGVDALSSINSGNSAVMLRVFQDLGYTVNYFRILDTGGTVFSDMLLNVDQVLSASPLDPDLYEAGDTVAGVQIGTPRYGPVAGLMYSEDALDDYFDLTSIPDRLNALYRAFTDGQGTLAEALDPELTVSGEGMRTYTLTCRLRAPAFVYMKADGMAMNITADGQAVAVPSYLNLSNTVYPAPFNSNLLCLGLFEPGRRQVQFTSAMDLQAGDVTLIALDKAALDGFRDDANLDPGMTMAWTEEGLSVTVTADRAGRRLYLPSMTPYAYDCTVNGEAAPLSYFIGVLASVPLQEGENRILLAPRDWSQSPFSRDRLPSTVCLCLALLWLVLRQIFPRLRTLVLPRFVYGLAQLLFYAVAAAVAGFVYVMPMYNLIVNGTVIRF